MVGSIDLGRIEVKFEGGFSCELPPLLPIDQHFERARVANISEAISKQISKIPTSEITGKSIAITVGSRGIAGLVRIVAALVGELRDKGGHPFIVPAMGSHGGATTEGQVRVLASYGITEASTGAPIRASMDVVEVAQLEDGTPLFIDRIAAEADCIVLANKIKPHADFKAAYESGLVKMLCIGLGKHKGAVTLHRYGFEQFHRILPEAAKLLLNRLNILFGVAILENAFDDLMRIEIISANRILTREKELLNIAKRSIGRLIMREIDILIVDEIGKNISGEGMDPNVTGRPGSGLSGFDAPDIQKIVVLDITPQSHGNGVGIGIADVSTRRCVGKIDLGAMYTNAIAATVLKPAKLPVILNNDRDAICVAMKTCNMVTPESVRIVRIRNTLQLHRIWVSPAMLDVVSKNRALSIAGEPVPMQFDSAGSLI